MKRAATILLALASAAAAQSVQGLWNATVTVNQLEIPFRFEIAGDAAHVSGAFFNGDEKVASTGGKLENGALTLRFDHYATRLEATLKDGVLEGSYGRAGHAYPFRAERARAAADDAASAAAPQIGGLWEIPTASPKGEKAWHLIVRQKGAEVSAAILRVDGDTGTLTGAYKNGAFVLSHFSGARPSLLVITPAADGSLELVQNGSKKLIAVRPAEARAKGLPEPDDPMQHTTMKDPSEPLRFSFPDLTGHLVSNTDARFRGKPVIVAIGGSWCPNCHDEAPFLEELYRKYHAAGLEIVALSFEEQDQLKDPARLRAFVKEYGIEYTVLIAGEPSELNAKMPQAVGLNAWPTTFFVGRDGRVAAIHTGFAARASGPLHDEMVAEIHGTVERLLAQPAGTVAAR